MSATDAATMFMAIMMSLLGFAGVGAVAAIVELIKSILGAEFPARYYPLIAVTVGALFNLVLAYLLAIPLPPAVFVGCMVGLSAAKLFEYGKSQEFNSARTQFNYVVMEEQLKQMFPPQTTAPGPNVIPFPGGKGPAAN